VQFECAADKEHDVSSLMKTAAGEDSAEELEPAGV
jgi:hypothetical protein